MKALESRKQLLIAESELNRASLNLEWQCLVVEVHALRRRVETIGSIAKAAATLVSGLSSLRNNKPAPEAKKASWWQLALKTASMAGSFWSEVRAKDRDQCSEGNGR
jgi:hypothetical protein